MATVDSWFLDWQGKHIRRFPRPDWPPAGDVFWEEFESLFIRHGVTEEVAAAASSMLFEEPPAFVGQHPEMMLEKVRVAWRESRAKTIPVRPEATAAERSNGAFDRGAEAHWSTLDDSERDEWRDLVRRRLPELAQSTWWVEGLAPGWAFDPASVCDPPPPRDASASDRGPRRPTFPTPNPNSKGS